MARIPNPYFVLRLSIRASNDDVTAQGMRLIAAEVSEDRQNDYRAAVEAVTTHPQEAAYHRFWEPGGARYHDDSEAAFLERYASDPADREALSRRAAAFLSDDCSALRLIDSLLPGPAPPARLEPFQAGLTPQAPLHVGLDPGDLFR